MPLKPVIVITLYRRYFELSKNLERLISLRHCFQQTPDVVLVWAAPEMGRMWFIEELLEKGWVQKVIGRPRLEIDGNPGQTTSPESINIRVGLEDVRGNYYKYYALLLSADIELTENGCRYIDEQMQGGASAVVFYWPNTIAPYASYHTNCFAVSQNRTYWPPVSPDPGHADVLERQWWMQLSEPTINGVVISTNDKQSLFIHRHETELQPDFPMYSRCSYTGIPLSICGHKSWVIRISEWFSGVFKNIRSKLKWQK